jgi:hypothetical protein
MVLNELITSFIISLGVSMLTITVFQYTLGTLEKVALIFAIFTFTFVLQRLSESFYPLLFVMIESFKYFIFKKKVNVSIKLKNSEGKIIYINAETMNEQNIQDLINSLKSLENKKRE